MLLRTRRSWLGVGRTLVPRASKPVGILRLPGDPPIDLRAPHVRPPCHIPKVSGVAPSIEDPFEPTRNLAVGVSALGLARWREELARAASLLSRGGEETSLTELLEPWTPPEQDAAAEPLSQ